jgi:tetratricopeptide (TPR) repeat protein
MSERVPIVRQTSWRAVVIQLIPLAVGVSIFLLTTTNSVRLSLAFGALAYVVYSNGSKRLIARSHRRGMRRVKSGQYEDAIRDFEESYAFFSKHSWLDRFRSITMLESSAIGYREMALSNIAFCYAQLGDGRQTKAYYERALVEFPNSAIAKFSLKAIEAFAETGNPEE